METVLSGMISNLALPAAPPPVDLSARLETSGTPTPPNSSASTTSTSLAIQTPSATSPATNSSTPGAHPGSVGQMMVSPIAAVMEVQTPPQQHHLQQGGSQQQQRTSRTFFRPPGLGPDRAEDDDKMPDNVMKCPHCGFSCSSKFHYNSHMNTHATHQCSMCNYQSRTEGRLKKHMQDSHTHEDRVAAGIAISPPSAAALTTAHQGQQDSPNGGGGSGEERQQSRELLLHNGGIPSSVAPLLNSMLSDTSAANGCALAGLESLQSMLNNTNPLSQFSNSDALLKICTETISQNGGSHHLDEVYNNNTNNSVQLTDQQLGSNAFDQLRALAERHSANLLATSTANALGFAGGELKFISQRDGGQNMGVVGEVPENGNSAATAARPKQDGPRRSGKPKQYKCKQCPQISKSKKEQWAHARLHIPMQKQLTCTLCDFVTEYKHHLEYHYRNHSGQKPFKCGTCAYTCVNKSMLNSHMKSHTPNYQFRCQDCTYQTKYCHSLKMHLKKYGHKRAPGTGGSESSDSHGEERPENGSSSSVGKDESFEHLGHQDQGHSDAATVGDLAMQSTPGPPPPHTLLMAHHQQMVGAEMEMASHRFMLQQQLEQMNELIRNHQQPPVNCSWTCPHCNFNADNIDDMNRHLLCHLIATQHMPQLNEQQALASIYQRLAAQLQEQLAPEHPMMGIQEASVLLAQAANSVQQQQSGMGEEMEREAAENIRHHNHQQGPAFPPPPPTSTAADNNAPGPSSSSSSAGGPSRFGPFGLPNGCSAVENGLAIQRSTAEHQPAGGTCVIKNVMSAPVASILAGMNGANFDHQQNGVGGPPPSFGSNVLNHQFSSVQQPGQTAGNLPFFCQQCEIAFKDEVLHQLHLGYHSIESPFKCNRCGHLSRSALEFNLHLYQARHE